MTISITDPLVTSYAIPKWTLPIKGDRVRIIEIIGPDDADEVRKVLEVWEAVYRRLPRDINGGYLIARSCKCFFSKGKVLVARDSHRIPQAFARIILYAKGMQMEELIVAPWNNADCREFIKLESDPDLVELASLYKKDVRHLIVYNKGTGTLVMYALCKLVLALRKNALVLLSSQSATDFYTKLGMRKVETAQGPRFFLDLSSGIAKSVSDRARIYFPRLL